MAESNLFAIYGKSWLAADRNFCFIRQKASYHFQRLENWNCWINQ
jgi:hypothetical protein